MGETCTLMISGQLPGEVVYTALLSMGYVKYSTYVRRIVADFLHVILIGYSSRLLLILLLLRSYITISESA
ncbi:hypothetical protein Tco_0669937 [Tanacetum coccineum]